MPETGGRGSRGRLAVLIALAALALPAPARAETRPVTCSNLQSTIDSLALKGDHGEGDTLVLGAMCSGAQLAGKGIVVPSHVGFTLQGAAGAGIDGAGLEGPLLSAPEAGALTLEGLTFRHASTNGSAAVSLRAARVTIAFDSFIANSATGSAGAGLSVDEYKGEQCPAAGAARLTVRGSVFAQNTLTVPSGAGGGAGAFLLDGCPGAPNAIEGNVVEANTLRADGAGRALGAGFELVSGRGEASGVVQRGNVFQGNRIDALGGEASYGGGGEWLDGLSLSSVADRWSGNSIPGAGGASSSRGAGVGILACGAGAAAQSSAQDAVIAANSIAGGLGPAALGAGAFVGCDAGVPGGLSLLDSTVTVNSAQAGGTAGLAGSVQGALAMANTIVLGDIGGGELSGFGAGLSASFSDVCAPGTLAALTGERNVCTDPRLADQGNPASADVHETSASPTHEAGSDAFVPAGLATDYYGAPRIAGGTLQPTCLQGLVAIAAPVVDIGAAELAEPLVRANGATACPAPFRRSSFAWPAVSVRPGGVLLLTFRGLTKGTLIANASVRLTETVVRTVGGRRRRVRRTVNLAYGSASRLGAIPSPLRLRIAPRRRALAALRRRRRLTVSLSVLYAADRLFPAKQTRAVAVRWAAPARRR